MDGGTRGSKWFGITRYAAVMLAGLLVGYLLGRRAGPSFSERQFDQINPGMTEGQVENILGLPAGDYRPAHWIHPDHYTSTMDVFGNPLKAVGVPDQEIRVMERKDVEEWDKMGRPFRPAKVTWKLWQSRSYSIHVAFDEQNRVLGATLIEMVTPRAPPDLARKLRWWWLNL